MSIAELRAKLQADYEQAQREQQQAQQRAADLAALLLKIEGALEALVLLEEEA